MDSNSKNNSYPWRLFWLLLVMAVLGVFAILPIAREVIAAILPKLEVPNIPLPLIILLGAVQNLTLLAIMIWLGLKLSRSLGLGAPILEYWTERDVAKPAIGASVARGVIAGVAVGIVLVPALLVLMRRLPNLPFVLAARLPIWQRFLACFYGGIYEEVVTRLFLLTLIAWIANRTWRKPHGNLSNSAFWFANILAAVLFGLGHLPSASFFMQITPLVVVAALILNGIAGIVFGYLYRRNGLESAMVAHFTTDFVIWVVGAALL